MWVLLAHGLDWIKRESKGNAVSLFLTTGTMPRNSPETSPSTRLYRKEPCGCGWVKEHLWRTPAPGCPPHTSLQEEATHWSRLFLGHRPSTQPSCDSGLGLPEHRLSETVSAAEFLQRTSRRLTPRPQVLEHLRRRKGAICFHFRRNLFE